MISTLCQRVPAMGLPWMAAVGTVVYLAWATPAAACSTLAPDPAFDGMPADGETAVPTDAVPYYQIPIGYGYPAELPGKFVLETTAGVAVPIEARLAPQLGYFEVAPMLPLAPRTAYRLRGTWTWPGSTSMQEYTDSLEFTTDDGPRTGPIPVPTVTIQNLDLVPLQLDSCTGATQRSCITVHDAKLFIEYTTLTAAGSSTLGPYGARGAYFETNLDPRTQSNDAFRCSRVRVRAINGQYSEPVTVCGEGAPTYRVSGVDRVGCEVDGLKWSAEAKVTLDGQPLDEDAGTDDPPQPDPGGLPPPPDAGSSAGAAGNGLPLTPPCCKSTSTLPPPAAGSPAVDAGTNPASTAKPPVIPVGNKPSSNHVKSCTVTSGPGHAANSGNPWWLILTLPAAVLLRRSRRARVG